MEASAIEILYRENEKNNKSDLTDSQIFIYADFLDYHFINFSREGSFLQIGAIPEQGWVIYISVIRQQMKSALGAILPVLLKLNVSFKIPENYNVHGMILDGGLGYHQIGKVISIYPLTAESAVRIAKELIDKSTNYVGPEIPDTRLLGNGVYAGFEYHSNSANTGFPVTKLQSKLTSWPFGSIGSINQKKASKWLQRKYFKVQCLKNDAKGDVYKGLNFNRWSNIHWCIIKEGKKCQCRDDAGRDIKDRLLWQFKVQTELGEMLPLPKAIDYFEANGDSYFVMEYIDGKSYHDLISEIQKGVIWSALGTNEQTALIKLALQVVDIVGALHSHGYIHRDLSPANFMVAADGKMVAIDIELCYNFIRNEPDPIFTLGTAGYMSPAQARCEIPMVEDDIYGLGNLLIRTFTGISPIKYNNCNLETLFENLNYFIRNRRLTMMICSCCQSDPLIRPTLASIKHCLELYLSQIITNKHLDSLIKEPNFNDVDINQMIHKAIQSLFKFPQLAKNEKWYSKTRNDEQLIANDFKSYSNYPEFHSGTAGVIYTLTLADQFGFDLGNNRAIFYENFSGIHKYYEENSSHIHSGLYAGTGGVAVVMASMIKYGLLENNINQVNLIASYLALPNHSLNIINGVAGQGLAMMKCADLLEFPSFAKPAIEIAEFIIRQQKSDGSWMIKKDEFEKKGVKLTGFLYGISGIVYFLLIYGVRYYSQSAINAAKNALSWLLKLRKSNAGQVNWPVSAINGSFDPWFEYGFTGVAFLFIKAYELLGDEIYKDAAESALRSHPKGITSNYITQASGISGVGNTYLDAYKVFGNVEWLDRAKGIVEFLNHTYINQGDDGIYWLDGSDDTPTAEFMSGNSGIINFLLRFQNPKKIDFPLVSL
jgi:serine/threonine protein kinase